jgi:hypothetical protein
VKCPDGFPLAFVVDSVCASIGVTIPEACSRSKHANIVQARAISTWLARKYTIASFPEIARQLGRLNHSSVVTAYYRVEKQVETGATVQHTNAALARFVGQKVSLLIEKCEVDMLRRWRELRAEPNPTCTAVRGWDAFIRANPHVAGGGGAAWNESQAGFEGGTPRPHQAPGAATCHPGRTRVA